MKQVWHIKNWKRLRTIQIPAYIENQNNKWIPTNNFNTGCELLTAKCINGQHLRLILRYENVIGLLALSEVYQSTVYQSTVMSSSEFIEKYQPIYYSDTDIMDMAVSDDGLYIALTLTWDCKIMVSRIWIVILIYTLLF